ncbi:unnamed protein product [Gadus morhua 'NCC']
MCVGDGGDNSRQNTSKTNCHPILEKEEDGGSSRRLTVSATENAFALFMDFFTVRTRSCGPLLNPTSPWPPQPPVAPAHPRPLAAPLLGCILNTSPPPSFIKRTASR